MLCIYLESEFLEFGGSLETEEGEEELEVAQALQLHTCVAMDDVVQSLGGGREGGREGVDEQRVKEGGREGPGGTSQHAVVSCSESWCQCQMTSGAESGGTGGREGERGVTKERGGGSQSHSGYLGIGLNEVQEVSSKALRIL